MEKPSPKIAPSLSKETDMPDLLIELFSEEIPARMQAKAASDLQKAMTDGLVEAGLTYAGAAAFAYAQTFDADSAWPAGAKPQSARRA